MISLLHNEASEYPTYTEFSRKVRLSIKVQNSGVESTEEELYSRVTVDRDTVTYNKLKSYITKTFNLKTAFLITYYNKSDVPLAIADDWDLDAALQQCTHSLKLSVHCSFHFDVSCADHTEVESATPQNVPNNQIVRMDNSKSLLHRFFTKINKLLPFKSKNRTHDSGLDTESHWNCSKSPMTLNEFQTFLDSDGRMVSYQVFRERVYRAGVSPKFRKIAWRHLLNIFPEGLTGRERMDYLKTKAREYHDLKSSWKTIYRQTAAENMSEEMKFVTSMVKKDVTRCDRSHPYYKGREDNKHIMSLFDLLCTYSLNHPDVSYCQGMCDFASPLLIVQDNEANAYLLFCSLMERIKSNFSFDGKAISTKFEHLTQLLSYFDQEFFNYMQENQVDDLLFTYRWILLEMKREFPFDESLLFTEVMWSTLPMKPRRQELSLYETKKTDKLTCANPLLFLSPFAKLNSLSNADSMSQFSDSEPLSLDTSVGERELTLEHALSFDDTESISGEPSLTSQSSLSRTTCHCFDELEVELPKSTFYIDLSEADYYFLTGEINTDTFHPMKCNCSSSVDSGFLSRPNSPSRQHENPNFEESIETQNLFPPPQEMGCGNPFVILTALTMILRQRDTIMDHSMDFNDILMLFNNSMRKHDVRAVLRETRLLYEAYIRNDFLSDVDEFVHL